MLKITVKYEVFRVNPFVPLPSKGKPPQFALMPASIYREMLKYYKRKKHQPFSSKGGLVRASLYTDEGTLVGKGMAICSMSDEFVARDGMRLALNRAFDSCTTNAKAAYGQLMNGLANLQPGGE